MSLEQFGFVKSACYAAISSAVDSEDQTEDACKSDDPTAPPSKRRRFNSNWTEGHTWHEHRNQFVKGCNSVKLGSVKKHEESRQHKDAEVVCRVGEHQHH